MVLQRVSQPKTRRTKAALLEREPKIIENTKTCMFIKGGNTSDVVGTALKELYLLKKPDAISYRLSFATPMYTVGSTRCILLVPSW